MDSLIISHFATHDPILSRVIGHIDDLKLPEVKSYDVLLSELCETIIGQQLSVKAARTIWSRVEPLCKNWNDPTQILSLEDVALRSAGVSYQKISYIKNCATAWVDGTVDISKLAGMDDSDVIDALVQIKGVGTWTAEMLLIFSMGRKDVFSKGDLGLKNAIERLYGTLNKDQQDDLIESWKPYRSYASLALWKSLDNEPKTT